MNTKERILNLEEAMANIKIDLGLDSTGGSPRKWKYTDVKIHTMEGFTEMLLAKLKRQGKAIMLLVDHLGLELEDTPEIPASLTLVKKAEK